MAFRLRQVDVTATGREIVRDRDLAKTRLTLGRAAENDIHLPDLALDPQHATMAIRADGLIDVEAAGTLGFAVDGHVTTQAVVDPRSGGELRFGSYRITLSQDENGGAVLLLIRLRDDADKAGDLEEKIGFSLAGVLPGKRAMSWIAVALIVVLFLALPIGSFLTRDAQGTVIGDASWSAGKLSLAHHALEGRCEACHVRAFESVRDETCLGCHRQLHDHARPARLLAARGGQPLGQQMLWAVAHAFGKQGPGACADCHVEHEGETRMQPPAQQFCADCHASLKDHLADTPLGDAADFGRRHPQFTPAVVTDPFARGLTAVTLDANPRENSGLSFSHKLHLESSGGVARMAASFAGERGYGAGGLQCRDCHRPSEDGVRFQPIDMERDCEGCHSLAYDRVGAIFRRLRHGDVEQMVADLSVVENAGPLVANRVRPGDYAEGRPYHFNYSAPSYNATLIREALSKGGICGECHAPTFEDGRPAVVPVTLVSRYLQQGRFDHKAHNQEACSSCHRAETSSFASELLLPGIKHCRTCHLGESAADAKVPSGCAMCHSYHPPASTQAGRRVARK